MAFHKANLVGEIEDKAIYMDNCSNIRKLCLADDETLRSSLTVHFPHGDMYVLRADVWRQAQVVLVSLSAISNALLVIKPALTLSVPWAT